MYPLKRRKRRRKISKRKKLRNKQKGGFFLALFIYQQRAMTKHLKKQYNINS